MNNWDNLYDQIMKQNEKKKKENFNVFMNSLQEGLGKDISTLVNVLNKDYANNSKDYEYRLLIIKMAGYKVYRNGQGKHLIK